MNKSGFFFLRLQAASWFRTVRGSLDLVHNERARPRRLVPAEMADQASVFLRRCDSGEGRLPQGVRLQRSE